MENHWHILGAGAMGCLFAGTLRQAGSDVTLLLRDTPGASRIALVVEDRAGRREYQVNASSTGDEGAIGRLLVTTKAYDVPGAVTAVAHRLNSDCRVLLLANGMGFTEQVREQIPRADIYCGTTTEGAYRLGPWEVRHAGRGGTRIGQPGRAAPPGWFARWARAVPGSHWEPDIERALWLKLAINCAINPLTAIHRCSNGELLSNPDLKVEVERLCAEIEQVSRAVGRVDIAERLRESVAEVIRGTAANRSSMLQDILAGGRTEIDYITGHLVKLAGGLGVPVPYNAAILHRVKALEN